MDPFSARHPKCIPLFYAYRISNARTGGKIAPPLVAFLGKRFNYIDEWMFFVSNKCGMKNGTGQNSLLFPRENFSSFPILVVSKYFAAARRGKLKGTRIVTSKQVKKQSMTRSGDGAEHEQGPVPEG
jgi:hypothetical protein